MTCDNPNCKGCGCSIAPQPFVDDEPTMVIPKPSEFQRLKDFFFNDSRWSDIVDDEYAKKHGRCPICGELGRYHLSTPICSEHGPY